MRLMPPLPQPLHSAVVEPQSSGAGGDGFILIYSAKTGTVSAINATGAAPTGATPRICISNAVGFPMKGILSVSIPGLVDGWLVAHEHFGTLPLEDIFAPAIAFCEDGFPLSHKLADSLRGETTTLCFRSLYAGGFPQMTVSHSGPEILSIRKTWVRPCGKIATEGRDAYRTV